MAVQLPTKAQILEIAAEVGLDLSEEDVSSFQNLFQGSVDSYNAVDEMWYLAGDNSTDFNFYTKRAILSGIYVNALFVLFNKDFKQVEINIDKNLKKISKIPKFKERFSFIKDNIPVILKGLLS